MMIESPKVDVPPFEGLPLGLRNAIDSGDCVLFVGAGVGKHLISTEGRIGPTGRELAREIANHFSIETNGDDDLAKVSQVVEIRKGRIELENFIRNRLQGLDPDETFQWLFKRRWRAIYTTNYDNSIERAYGLLADPPQTRYRFL